MSTAKTEVHMQASSLSELAVCYGRLGAPSAKPPFARCEARLSIVIGWDASVVAQVIERSNELFTSPLGTWISFTSI
jgi:hypothetical protein